MFLYFSIFIISAQIAIVAFSSTNDFNNKTMSIENPPGSGNFIDLFDYLLLSKNLLIESFAKMEIKKKAIMIMGVSGSGKSTLVNYLNGVPLLNKRLNNTWRIVKADMNSSLPGGFDIGHTTSSKTTLPAFHSPVGKDFSYVDNPGFSDNRGIAADISNGFFREYVTQEVLELKFLLLITEKDVTDRGDQFRSSIKAFSNFLEVFSKTDLKRIDESIGIIVTKVVNFGASDASMIKTLRNTMLEIVNTDTTFSGNGANVFRSVINNHVAIFSNPAKENSRLSNQQRLDIEQMIDGLRYIKKEDAIIKISISENYLPQLRAYVDDRFIKFESLFEKTLNESIINYFTKAKSQGNDLSNYADIYQNLNDLIKNVSLKTDFENYIFTIKPFILNEYERSKLIISKKIIDFFIGLIPNQFKIGITMEKQWISVNLVSTILNSKKDIFEFFQIEYRMYPEYFEKEFARSINKYLQTIIKNAVYVEDITNFDKQLDDLIFLGIQTDLDIDSFLKLIPDGLFTNSQKKYFLKEMNILKILQINC